MITLICGGRDYQDYAALCRAMIDVPVRPSIIVQGGARGADALAIRWAKENSIHYATVPALWDELGKSAGPKRNSVMLLLGPQYCVAMPGGSGTNDMARKCKAAGVPTWRPYG